MRTRKQAVRAQRKLELDDIDEEEEISVEAVEKGQSVEAVEKGQSVEAVKKGQSVEEVEKG